MADLAIDDSVPFPGMVRVSASAIRPARPDDAPAPWRSMGFDTAGRLPGAFRHPVHGEVDALVMFRAS